MVWSMGGWNIWVSTYKGVVSIGGNAVLLVFRDIVAIGLQQHVGGKWSLLRHIHDHSMT